MDRLQGRIVSLTKSVLGAEGVQDRMAGLIANIRKQKVKARCPPRPALHTCLVCVCV